MTKRAKPAARPAPQKAPKKAPKKTKTANAMWGGRFAGGPSEVMQEINPSIDFDKRFYAEDIAGSKAHAAMLVKQGIIAPKDGRAIAKGLDSILREIESGVFVFSRDLEDIHMNVEARLKALIGEAAGRLHTARSRNDQVATDFKLWVRDEFDHLNAALRGLQKALIDKATAEAATIMPGFTHLQAAQPVTLGHHLLAYVEMFGRDRGRLADARKRMNECPLGAAALAGTSFPIDRVMTAKALGFDRPSANSLDAVSDRDFALEFLGAGSIISIHLSRLAEELVLWSGERFNFVKLSDAFTTGSSIMPQKKNPDAAELLRGKTGRVIGANMSLITMMKGLPLAFNKDMQEDKEPLFDAADTLRVCIAAATGMISDMKPNRAAMKAATAQGFLTATDLADWLVKNLNLPFREAHHVTGAAVKLAEDKGCRLDELELEALQKLHPGIRASVYSVLSVERSVASRTSLGGTAPARVRAAAKAAAKRFL